MTIGDCYGGSRWWFWNRSARGWWFWMVSGKNEFATSGYAVMDDFGNLVSVP